MKNRVTHFFFLIKKSLKMWRINRIMQLFLFGNNLCTWAMQSYEALLIRVLCWLRNRTISSSCNPRTSSTIRRSNIRKLYKQVNSILCCYLDKAYFSWETTEDYRDTHASMLFELKEFISKMVGFVKRLYVCSSSFLASPPYIRGDLAIDHNVTCENKKDNVKIECSVISRVTYIEY